MAKINAKKLELHYLPENFSKIVDKIWRISLISIEQKKAEWRFENSRGISQICKNCLSQNYSGSAQPDRKCSKVCQESKY